MIAVTAASGHLGRLVVTSLLDAGTPADQVAAIVRDPSRAADLAERGVTVRTADYSDPQALREALMGVDRILLISGSEIGQRVAQHGNVVAAAADAGVSLLAYTSCPKADDTELPVFPDHLATERLIAESGVPAVILRNNWYFENYEQPIRLAASTGTISGSAGSGRIAAATRADLAAGAVAVLTSAEPTPGVLELGGDEAWTMAELAAAVAAEAGREVTYVHLAPEEQVAGLVAVGVPEPAAQFLAAADRTIAAGALDTGSHALSELLGRPTTTLAQYVHQVLATG